MNIKGKIVAFSSPSGGGKTTICRILLKRHENYRISVSATTRPPRQNEKDGIDYYFLSRDEFSEKIIAGEFLEYEQVHENLYGTLKSELVKAADASSVLMFDIDVRGALSIKDIFPQAILIFIRPPSIEELINRLQKRETESPEIIDKRLKRLPMEFNEGKKFDYIVINDELEKAVSDVEKIICG